MFAHRLRKPGLIPRITLSLGCGALAAALCLTVSSASRAQGATKPAVETQPLATVTGGQVQGRYLPLPGGAVFKGIPYAAPPIGDLRWRETQPVKPWTGILQTNQYGPACPQLLHDGNVQIIAASSEDCLFLNVWTPQWPAGAKKPVMLWLHGGGNTGGSGQGDLAEGRIGITPPFDGINLARHGVVVVTINYRLSLLGMIGHPELTAESAHHASGDYLLFDQIAALKWIHDNIARFGGDADNVTVFGQSAGAQDTALLVASPLAKGLIHRAILESSSNTELKYYPTASQLEQFGTVMAAVLKAPATGAIQYLRRLPASQIVAAMPEVTKRLNALHLAINLGVDGYAIPQNPAEVDRARKEAPVPMIVGNTALDTAVVNSLGPDASRQDVLAWMKGVLQTFYGKYPDLQERALKIYGVSGTPTGVSTYLPYGPVEDQLGVDLNHRCGSVTTALWHSRLAPTWEYEFTRITPGHPPFHEGELRFVWGSLANEEADAGARKLSDTMEQYWTNFAKTGDPNGAGLPAWPKYNGTAKPYMDFSNDGAVQKAAMRAGACDVYVEKFNRDPKPNLGADLPRYGEGAPKVVP